MRNLLAFDLGASNGRAILGQFDGEKLTGLKTTTSR
jgi:sugar (pentulose or hexulose) kinase